MHKMIVFVSNFIQETNQNDACFIFDKENSFSEG